MECSFLAITVRADPPADPKIRLSPRTTNRPNLHKVVFQEILRRLELFLAFPGSVMSEPPYRYFTQIGDPVLRQRAEEVPEERIDSPEIDQIVDRMVKVLRHYDCVGVAAPQIGIPLRIIVMEFREGKREQYKPEIYEERKMSTLPLAVSSI